MAELIQYNHFRSDEFQSFETDMAILADNDVIMDRNTKRLGRRDDHVSHINVGA